MTEAIVAEARVESGMRVLDVASGTGEPAISIATLLEAAGRVVATDISPGPLKIAAQRALERDLTNLEFALADVHRLPFSDRAFDRVTSRLGVMFFADAPRALSEMCRVLKPEGRASLLAWGPMEQPYFETTVGTILRLHPQLGRLASGAAMFKFGQPGALAAAFRQAGFARAEERYADVPWNWPDTPEELWGYFQEVTIPFKPLFQAIPPEARDAAEEQVLAALRRRYDGQTVRFDARIVLASATR